MTKPTTFLGRLGNNIKAGTVFKSEPGSVGRIVSAGVTLGLMGPLVAVPVALTAAAWKTCDAFRGILAPVRWLGKLSLGIVGGAAIVGAFAGSLATSLVLMPVNYALSEVILNPALSLIQAARGKTMEAKDYLSKKDKEKLAEKDPSLKEKYFPPKEKTQDRMFKQIHQTQQKAIIAAIPDQNNRDNEEIDENKPKLTQPQQLTETHKKTQGQNASVPLSAFNLSRDNTKINEGQRIINEHTQQENKPKLK